MTRKKSDIEREIKSFGYDLIDYYYTKNNVLKIIISDNRGYKYDAFLYNVRNLHPPKLVSGSNPYSLHNIKIWLKINDKKFRVITNKKIENNKERILFYCPDCDNTFYKNWNDLLNGGNCPICSKKKAGKNNNLKTLRSDLCEEWDYEKNKIDPENVTQFSNKSAYWVCKICGYEWKTNTIAERANGNGCSACSGRVVTDKNKLSILYPEIALEWHPTKNETLTLNDVSYGMGKKVWWLCSVCNFEWISLISDRTISKSGCPKCSESRGERRISNWLYKNKIYPKREFIFKECRNKRCLPFDFYLSDYNFCIEYHGEQHYKSISIFGGDKVFKEQKIRDKIKAKYCRHNNIQLLIIPYWEFDNIEKILKETLL